MQTKLISTMVTVSENFTHMITVSTENSLLNEGTNVSSSLQPLAVNKSVADIIQGKMNTAQYFVCPTLLVFGIVGNLCTVLTVSHVQFHQMTSRYILYALAASDSMLLLTNPFNQQFMLKIWGRDVRAISSEGCKLFFVMYRTGKMSSSWFIVLVAIERFVAILFPLKVKRFLTKATVSVAITIIYIAMLTLSALWTFSTDIVNGRCRADVTSANTVSLHKSFVIVGATCYSIAPMVILLSLTPQIIVKLYRSQRIRQDLQQSNVTRSAKDTSRVSIMLIGIVITYIICVTPITLVLILTFWTSEPLFSSQKPEYIILSGIAMTFEQLNHSSNFLVYIMCCRQFRERFFRMVRCSGKISGIDSSTFASITGHNSNSGSVERFSNSVLEDHRLNPDRKF